MTAMQRKWYKSILEKDIDAVNGEAHAVPSEGEWSTDAVAFAGAGGKKEGKTRLQNIVMQLRVRRACLMLAAIR